MNINVQLLACQLLLEIRHQISFVHHSWRQCVLLNATKKTEASERIECVLLFSAAYERENDRYIHICPITVRQTFVFAESKRRTTHALDGFVSSCIYPVLLSTNTHTLTSYPNMLSNRVTAGLMSHTSLHSSRCSSTAVWI